MAIQRSLMTFKQSLLEGQAYEDKVALYLESQGWVVMRTGRKSKCLDLMIGKRGAVYWVDVKSQTCSSRGQTGIKLEHYEKYCRIQEETQISALLVMVILTGEHSGVWRLSLSTPIDHEAPSRDRMGPCRMVYWNMSDLHRVGDLSIFS